MSSNSERNNRKGAAIYAKNMYQIAVLLVISIVGILFIFQSKTNSTIDEQIDKRDSLIMAMKANDSAYKVMLKEYSDKLSSYVSDCEITVDGKKITLNELVQKINRLNDENFNLRSDISSLEAYNSNLKNEVTVYKDSVRIFNAILGLAERNYNLKYSIRRSNDKIIVTANSNKFDSLLYLLPQLKQVDSGLILLPYYRDKLRYNSEKKEWIISMPRK